jgi:hypothetical protein
MNKKKITALVLALGLVALTQPGAGDVALAQEAGMYMVKITNLTPGQTFTPILAATHNGGASIFLPGTQASMGLESLAEEGRTMMLKMALESHASVMAVQNSMGLTTPAVTRDITIMGGGGYDRLSVVSMLIPTNDAFFGVDTSLPAYGETKVVYGYAYDAGTEMNDESCASIPGPHAECGGMGTHDAGGRGEGAITISNGILGHGDFSRDHDWKNPVARITIYMVQ